MAAQQHVVARGFKKNVQDKSFVEGDWVLRKAFQKSQEPNAGKLVQNGKIFTKINKVVGNGAYQLVQSDDIMVPRGWNTIHLERYFFLAKYQISFYLCLIQ